MTETLTPGTFLTPLVLRHMGGRKYCVEQDFAYVTRAGRILTVPAGFVTDGGSVPRLLWSLYPPFGSDCDEAYVLHDYAYAHVDTWGLSRGEADALMREVMEVKGFRQSGRFTVWAGVRLGGWLTWRRHRQREQEQATT